MTAARASFERLTIRFSEAVNRKAYILHNIPGFVQRYIACSSHACALYQHRRLLIRHNFDVSKQRNVQKARGTRAESKNAPPIVKACSRALAAAPTRLSPCRFTVAEGVNGQNLVKTSVQRGIRGARPPPRAASWLPQASIQLVGHVCCRYAYLDECLTLQFHYRTGAELTADTSFPAAVAQPSSQSSSPRWRRAGLLRSLSQRRISWWLQKGALNASAWSSASADRLAHRTAVQTTSTWL